ncbi:putative glutathione transferase [Dioscorea sansibarensis]
MAKDGVVLLSFWASPFGQRVQIALEEKGVKYKYKEQDMLNNESALFLESNPIYKKVPVLIHNGKPLCESLLIVENIDEVWADKARLLPAEPLARARERFWADFISKQIYDCNTRLWKLKGEAQEVAKKDFIKILTILEEQLGNNKFFGGETFGFVDMALVPFYGRFHAYEVCTNLNIEKECPQIVAWGKRCMERDSVSKTIPDPKKACEFILSLKKLRGVE